jgi:broad specificity phosphatase PhoE
VSSVFVYLVRHGETDWNAESRLQGHRDIALNDVGRDQARDAATRLPRDVARVVASDLLRARETGEIIARALGVSIELDPALRERSFGKFEGLTSKECQARWPDAWRAYKTDPLRPVLEGEPYPSFVERARRAVVAAARRAARPGAPAAVVTHGGVVKAVLELETRAGAIVLVPNAAIYRFAVSGERLVLAPA